MDEIPSLKQSFSGRFKIAFRHMAEKTAHLMGSPFVFVLAVLLIILWGVAGFYFDFSDTWQLVINTATTIGTFLIVILIQNTQNRESRSIQLKLDELIRGTKTSRNRLLKIEDQSDEELDALKKEFVELREKYIAHLKKDRKKDSNPHASS